MARRVNKNFVIVLVVALVGAGGAVAGVAYWRMKQNHDPVHLADLASQALGHGDLDGAMQQYAKAANQAVRDHNPDAADYCAKVAELCYKTSDKDPGRYGQALAWWRQALVQRPSFREVKERLMKELYNIAMMESGVGNWAELEKESANMLKLDDKNGLAHAYHAESVRRQATVDDPTSKAKRQAARAELEGAIKAIPDDPTAYIALAFYHAAEARAMEALQLNAADVQKERDQGATLLKDFVAKHPTSLEARLALGQMYLEFGGISSEALAATRKAALETLQQAVQSAPDDVKAYAGLANYYNVTNNRAEEEKCILQMIKVRPNAVEPYARLASFYQRTGQLEQAREACKNVLKQKGEGIGMEALQSHQIIESMQYMLAMVCLDLAQKQGVGTPYGKASIQEAAGYIDLMHRQRAADPRLYFFDGYLLLLRGRVQDAQMTLSQADVIYSANKLMDRNMWFRTKMLLALSYELGAQDGSAIKLYAEITHDYPGVTVAWLKQGHAEYHQRNFNSAIACADFVLKGDPTNVEAIKIKADSLTQQGRYDAANILYAQLGSSEAVVLQARVILLGGDPQGALDALTGVDPENEQALGIAASAKGMLADRVTDDKQKKQLKDSAMADVAKLLAKHPHDARLSFLMESLANPNASREDRFKAVVADLPTAYDQEIAWAQFYAQEKDQDKQLEHLRKAAQLKDAEEGPIDAIFQLAVAMQKWDLAEEYAQKAGQLNIDGVKGKLYEGRLKLAKGEKERALEILQQGVAERPGFSMAHTTLAVAYVEMGQTNQALSELDIAIAQKPDNIAALKTIIGILLSQSDVESVSKARSTLEAALRFFPGDPQLRGYRDLIGDPNEVIRDRMRVYDRNPKDVENARGLTVALVRAGKLDTAIEVFKKIYDADVDNFPNADVLARLYRDAHQEDNAQKIYEHFLISPKQEVKFLAMLRQADMLRSLNKGPEAIQIYQDARQLEPKGDNQAERRLADLYFDVEDLAHAEELYKQISDTAGAKDIVVLRRYIETLVREHKFQAADALLADRILKADPDDAQGLVLAGFSLLQQGELKKAIEYFDRILRKDPNNADALHYRAATRSAMQTDLQAAITDLLRAREIRPNFVNTRLLLARVYRQNRQYSEAVKEYQEVLKINPDFAPARLEFANFLYMLAEAEQRIPADAADPFPRMLRDIKPVEVLGKLLVESAQRFKNQPAWLIRQGDLLSMLGQKAQAAEVYRQTMEQMGQNPIAGSAYVGILVDMKQYDRAQQVASALIALNSKFADLYIKRARALAGQAKQAESLADFDEAMKLASTDLGAYLNVVRQLYVSLPSDVTIAHLEDLIKKEPKNVAARIGLAQACLTANNSKKAEDALLPLLSDKALDVIRPGILRMTALACYQNGEFDKALGYYDELLKLAPYDLETLNNVAYLLANDMKPPQAKKALEYAERSVNALQMQPQEIVYVNNGNVFDTRGWCKYLAGDVDGARVDLQHSLQTDPLPVTYYHMGMILRNLDRRGEAKQMFESCIKLGGPQKDPSVPLATEQLKKLAGG